MSSFKDSAINARLLKQYKRCTLVLGFSLVASTFSANVFAACEYVINNQWGNGFQASIKISNTTGSVINGWSVSWQYSGSDRITDSWNATLSGSNPYSATNISWNGAIQPGQSVEFGFQGTKSAAVAQVPVVTGAACGGVTSSSASNSSSSNPVSSSSLSSGLSSSSLSSSNNSSVTGNSGEQCHWYGTLYPLCVTTATGWGWEGNKSCIARTTCVTQPPPYGVVGVSSSSSLASSSSSIASSPSSSSSLVSSSSSSVVASSSSLSSNSSVANGLVTWDLDGTHSFINLVTTKNTHNVESHRFDRLAGSITDNGEASFIIDLTSINTGNTTRDQRMRTLLFDTTNFPSATVTVLLDMDQLTALSVGSLTSMNISAHLDLHGVDGVIETTVLVQKLSSSRVMVQNTKPLLIKAPDYSLEAGVEALRAAANLTTVSTTAPVDFVLFFDAR